MIELLTSYCNWVHPQLPFLDLDVFLASVLDRQAGEAAPPTSLLLFQAVMFAGSAHTDEKVFRVHGYPSKIEAQNLFFQRVKVRSDSNCVSLQLTVFSFFINLKSSRTS